MSNYKKMTYILKTAGLILAVVVFVASVYFLSTKRKVTSNNYSDVENIAETAETAATPGVAAPVPLSPPETLPAKKLLKIDFAAQAPFGDWSEPYENACEEASIIMVKHYLENKTLSKEQMKTEIDLAVAWQLKNWSKHTDLDADKTLILAQDYFKLSGQTLNVTSIDDLKKQLTAGYPVIVPSAGRKLGNPNFTGVGPEYHMLVLKGYDDTEGVFITNDPGTRKGESYVYKYQVLFDAISGPKVDGVKKVLTVWK